MDDIERIHRRPRPSAVETFSVFEATNKIDFEKMGGMALTVAQDSIMLKVEAICTGGGPLFDQPGLLFKCTGVQE